MLNLNDPMVISAAIAIVLALFFLVWLVTKRSTVVPPAPPTVTTDTAVPDTEVPPTEGTDGPEPDPGAVGALEDGSQHPPTMPLGGDTPEGVMGEDLVEAIEDDGEDHRETVITPDELEVAEAVTDGVMGEDLVEAVEPEAEQDPTLVVAVDPVLSVADYAPDAGVKPAESLGTSEVGADDEEVQPFLESGVPADDDASVVLVEEVLVEEVLVDEVLAEDRPGNEVQVDQGQVDDGQGDDNIQEDTAAHAEDLLVEGPEDAAEDTDVDDTLAAESEEAQPDGGEAAGETEAEAAVEEEAPKLSFFARFSAQLTRSRNQLGAQLRSIFGGGLDEDAWEDLEDSLISADVGVDATMDLVEQLRTRVKEEGITTGSGALDALKAILREDLAVEDRSMRRRAEGPSVWLFTGVNGTGKTTSIGKLTKRYTDEGDHIVLAAADTFRAAAADQLKIWGERSHVRVIAQDEGADPAAVAFDGWQAASAAKADLLLIDTAGRLQNKTELMAELSKIKRVVERDAGPIDEVLLVLDATTGQNGLSQAKAFADAVDLTGVVLTKLDGTAKGGIVIAIQRTLGIPVKWVGIGEGIEDLAPFDPDAFIEALFSDEGQ